MKIITAYLKQKHPDLPGNYHVYSHRLLDGEGDQVVRFEGAIARPLQRGKNKGQLTWGRKLEGKRTFLMSLAEYKLASENVEVAV